DRLALADMLVEDGGDISFGHVLVPDAVWVDDHGASQLAGTQAVRWGQDALAGRMPLQHPEVELVADAHGALLSAGTPGRAGETVLVPCLEAPAGTSSPDWQVSLRPSGGISKAAPRTRSLTDGVMLASPHRDCDEQSGKVRV